MKALIKLFIILLISQSIFGQDFSKVDEYSKKVPASVAKSTESLSQYLCKPTKSDIDKVRAFYIWITHNIAYDLNAFLNNTLVINENLDEFLKRKKGVCQDYANLFKALCDHADIRCFVISGYSKGFGANTRTQFEIPDHSWNAVFVEGKWQLIDATWGSGHVNEKTKFVRAFNDKFFLQEPKELIYTHLPIDPMWQLLECPITIEDFKKHRTQIKEILNEREKCFSYNDSIAEFSNLSIQDQELKRAINSFRFNPKNKINIGLAYMNYGVSKSQEIMKKQKELTPEELLDGMTEILSYYKIAKEYLKGVPGDNGKEIRDICNQNMKSTQSNIDQLKKIIDK